jgi:inorganic triphosphatase YgiF
VSTEIEAKFLVAGHGAAERIRALTHIGNYFLSHARTETVQDMYLDTTERALLAAGFACRRREHEGLPLITIKSIDSPRGAVHRREELEVVVSGSSPPQAWPASAARAKVLGLIGEGRLEEMFRLSQTRVVRRVLDGERHVADCSLDEISVGAGESARSWTELEVELASAGSEGDLAALNDWLRANLNLQPSTASKFELALDAVAPAVTKGPRLAQMKSIFLEAPATLAGGLPFAALSAMGYTAVEDRHLTDQLIYFDTHDGALLKQGWSVVYSRALGTWRLFEGEDLRAEQNGPSSVPPVQGEWAAMLRAVCAQAPSIPFLEAAVIETEYQIDGLGAHLLRVRAQQWTFLVPWADAGPKTLLQLLVTGPSTGCAYFSSLLQARLRFSEPLGTVVERALALLGIPAPGAPLPAEFRVNLGDSVGRAFCKILQGEAWKMRANVRGAIHDLDPEFIHDLRVATRRARSALRLFSRLIDPVDLRPFADELGWIARLLGATRDLDVIMARLEEQFEMAQADPVFRKILRERLRARRAQALSGIVEALKSKRFAGLLNRLDLAQVADNTVQASRFARVRIDKSFGKLALWIDRPPESLTDPELHRIRILFKRLRYACEFFRPLLGDEAAGLIGAFVGFQDCLGLHQDAATALHTLSGILEESPSGGRTDGFLLSMGAMLQVQRDIQRAQRERFVRRWASASELFDLWRRLCAQLRDAE